MIKKILKIKGLGIFSEYVIDQDIREFQRVNLIYGWNGSGKTTLSKLFACLENGSSSEFPELSYEIETEGGKCKSGSPLGSKIRVFNQDYIENNVQLVTGKANPIFILGEENKELLEQVKKDEENLQKLENEIQSRQLEKGRLETEKGKSFTNVASVIGANLVGSSTRNYRKPDAERDFEALTATNVLSEAEVAKQRGLIKQEQKEKIFEITPNMEFDLEKIYSETEAICNETVEVNVIEELFSKPNVSEWIEQGLELHGEQSEKCEFCGSAIPENRIKELLGHFNDADKKLKERINNKIESFQEMIKSANNVQPPNKAQLYSE